MEEKKREEEKREKKRNQKKEKTEPKIDLEHENLI